MQNKHKIVVAITGASGAIYAKVLLNKLQQLFSENTSENNPIEIVSVVMSDNAKDVWKFELGNTDYEQLPFTIHNKNDFFAPFASGSAKYDIMIICPCSMGTLGRIAAGISNDLTTRAADVILKERRKLILVTRDTPLSLIHINNMKTVTEAGGIICPASPSFYSQPTTFDELAATVIDRVIDLCGLNQATYRWGDKA
jgi:flavin prenyltransferase